MARSGTRSGPRPGRPKSHLQEPTTTTFENIIDPDSPAPGDLDEIERLQAEALKLKNQIVETHLRLVVSVAKKHVRACHDLEERISEGNFALLRAVDRFDFARSNRFSTYATWACVGSA